MNTPPAPHSVVSYRGGVGEWRSDWTPEKVPSSEPIPLQWRGASEGGGVVVGRDASARRCRDDRPYK